MEHVVFFPAADGSPTFRRVPSLEEAVRLVEHLRNVEGLSTVSVHSLTEVPLAFRAYYRVEVPAPIASPGVPAQPPVGVEPRAAARPVPEPVAVPSSARTPAPLVLVEDLDTGDEPLPAEAAEQRDDAPAEPEPALSTPASLGFFA